MTENFAKRNFLGHLSPTGSNGRIKILRIFIRMRQGDNSLFFRLKAKKGLSWNPSDSRARTSFLKFSEENFRAWKIISQAKLFCWPSLRGEAFARLENLEFFIRVCGRRESAKNPRFFARYLVTSFLTFYFLI